MILDEGGRVVGLWLFREPVTDEQRAVRLRLKLTHALGGDTAFASDPAPGIRVPGAATTAIYPRHETAIVLFEPTRRYDPDTLDTARA